MYVCKCSCSGPAGGALVVWIDIYVERSEEGLSSKDQNTTYYLVKVMRIDSVGVINFNSWNEKVFGLLLILRYD